MHLTHIKLSRSACGARLRGRDVEDFARFVEGEAGGGEGVGGRRVVGLRLGEFLRGAGLFVGFGEGAAEDARAGYEDLGYYAVRLLYSLEVRRDG